MEHVSNLPLTPAAAWEELTSEDFLRAFAEEVGVTVSGLVCESADGRESATMEWSFETDRPGIPELAKKFLPSNVHLTWSQWWEPLSGDQAKGRIDVQLKGRPSAKAVGICGLAAEDGGSRLTTSTTTKADLPFPLAGTVESRVDKDLIGWIVSVQARVLLRRAADG